MKFLLHLYWNIRLNALNVVSPDKLIIFLPHRKCHIAFKSGLHYNKTAFTLMRLAFLRSKFPS